MNYQLKTESIIVQVERRYKMKYFQVKREYDNAKRKDGSVLIQNELYTPKEITKYQINPECLTEINIPSGTTYFCFGARFPMS